MHEQNHLKRHCPQVFADFHYSGIFPAARRDSRIQTCSFLFFFYAVRCFCACKMVALKVSQKRQHLVVGEKRCTRIHNLVGRSHNKFIAERYNEPPSDGLKMMVTVGVERHIPSRHMTSRHLPAAPPSCFSRTPTLASPLKHLNSYFESKELLSSDKFSRQEVKEAPGL